MAFILISKNGEEIKINAWNWRPTLELLRDAGLIDDDLCERMGTVGRAANLDAATAIRVADFLEMRLNTMRPEQRILADLTTTDKPKKQVTFAAGMRTEEIDAVDLYSASYEWFLQFRDFCRTSGGFEVR